MRGAWIRPRPEPPHRKPLSGEFPVGPDETRMTPAADTAPIGGAPASTASGSWLRPKVVIPVLAVLLLLVAVAFVAGRFRGEDVMSAKQHDSTTETTSRAATTTTATPTTTSVTTTSTTTPTATSTVAAQTAAVPVVVGSPVWPRCHRHHPEGTTVLHPVAVHQSVLVVGPSGPDSQPGTDHFAAGHSSADGGRVAGADLHAGNRAHPLAVRGGDSSRQRRLSERVEVSFGDLVQHCCQPLIEVSPGPPAAAKKGDQ